jgi:hypothetical protein
MTKDNAKDFLPLVQALADGKTIQGYYDPTMEWRDLKSPDFSNWPPDKFRIKPEPPKPREFLISLTDLGLVFDAVKAGVAMQPTPGGSIIRVREIIEE